MIKKALRTNTTIFAKKRNSEQDRQGKLVKDCLINQKMNIHTQRFDILKEPQQSTYNTSIT